MDPAYEEAPLGKIYDARLMRRLLGYARPYAGRILISILLLMAVTAADLAGPVLIKIAIDDHLRAMDRPRLALSPDQWARLPASLRAEAVPWDGRFLVREDRLPVQVRERLAGAAGRYRVLRAEDGRHHLVPVAGAPGVRPPAPAGSGDGARPLSPTELQAFRRPERVAVARIAWLYLALAAAAFGLAYAQAYLLHRTAQFIVARIRQQVFGHLQNLSLSYFDRHPVGRLVTRVTNDVETLNEMYTSVIVNLFRDLFMLAGIAGVMLAYNARLALVGFAVLPLVVGATIIFRNHARAAYREVRVRVARINAFLSENISGMRLIQIFRREQLQRKEFSAVNDAYLAATLRQVSVFAVFRPVIEWFSSLALALVLAYGGFRVLEGVLPLGVLVAFVQYVQRFFRPIHELAEKFNIMQSAMASAERIFTVLDTPAAIVDPPRPRVPARVRGTVQLDRVWFAYQDEDWVLRDVSLRIEPGETVAFVGHTGAGKTSILHLLPRFYDVQRGAVRIDGVDVREWPQEALRRHMAIVHQDVFLFSGSIRENIRMGDPSLTDSAVRQAAELVGAHEFIQRLPGGYDAQVTERGSTLSAGERQLLALARALVRDPAILILDEATAYLDTETEQRIQQALDRVTRNRTTLIVAHRLSTVQRADRIVVLHGGRIREMGSHEELLARRGLYYRLWLLHQGEAGQDRPQEPLAAGETALPAGPGRERQDR